MTITSETRSVAGRVTALYRRAGNADQNRLGLALLVIAVSQLIVLMDTTIVTMALPRIQSALGFSATGLLWVVNLYGLVFGSLLLLGGRVGDILGRRRVLIAGLALFSAASLLGGLAPGQGWLLAGRAAVLPAGLGLLGPAIQRRLPALDRGLRHRRRRQHAAAAPHRAPPADGGRRPVRRRRNVLAVPDQRDRQLPRPRLRRLHYRRLRAEPGLRALRRARPVAGQADRLRGGLQRGQRGPLVGGSVGLAALGTVAWTTAAHQIHVTRPGGAAATYRYALATGFDRAFLAAAGVALAILILAVALIRVRATGPAGQALPAAPPRAGQRQPQPEPNGRHRPPKSHRLDSTA